MTKYTYFRPDSTSCASWCPLSPTCRAKRLRAREEGQSGGWGSRERVEGQRGEGGPRGRVEGLRYVLPGRPTVEICFVLKFFKFFFKEKFDHFWPQLQLGFTVVCLHRLKDCILSGYYTPGPDLLILRITGRWYINLIYYCCCIFQFLPI